MPNPGKIKVANARWSAVDLCSAMVIAAGVVVSSSLAISQIVIPYVWHVLRQKN